MSDVYGIGSLIGSGLEAGASIFNNASNVAAQKEINAQNLAYAKETRDLQWQRDDNAMQRRVSDLKLAGLNPAVAAGVGGAANSQPLGYQGQAAKQSPIITKNMIAEAFQNGARMAQSSADIEKMHTDMENSTNLTNQQIELLKKQIEDLHETTRGKKLENDIVDETGHLPSQSSKIERDILGAKNVLQSFKEVIDDQPIATGENATRTSSFDTLGGAFRTGLEHIGKFVSDPKYREEVRRTRHYKNYRGGHAYGPR